MRSQRKTLIGGVFVLLACLAGTAPAQDTIDMRGKTVLITGSTSGLGAEVATRIGAMGATVIIHGRSAERGREVVDAINAAGPGRAIFYQADLSSLAEVKALADRVKDEQSALHLLINNAGILGANGDPRQTSADGHELIFAVNYLSHFLLTRELLPLLDELSDHITYPLDQVMGWSHRIPLSVHARHSLRDVLTAFGKLRVGAALYEQTGVFRDDDTNSDLFFVTDGA